MTGRVKDHFWDQISGEYQPTPEDELEMLQIDAETAAKRYAEALKNAKPKEPEK